MTVDSDDARPCAFLFAAPLRDEEDGGSLDGAFLTALKAVDPQGAIDTRVYRGGLLLASLSYKPSSVRVAPNTRRRGASTAAFRTSVVEQSDRALYAVVVGDFVETCLQQWNTIDSSTFWDYAGNRSLDTIFAPSLTAGTARGIDSRLRLHPRYIGAVSPDLGNPLHSYLFVEMLFNDAFIRNGRVFLRADFDGNYEGWFDGADTFSPEGAAILPYQVFESTSPSTHLPSELSARGLVTEIRMRGRMALDVHQRVMRAFDQTGALREVNRPFEWDISQLPDAPDEATIQAKKLTHYLLNPTHEDGGSKAKFFERQLAITNRDWKYLESQFIDGLRNVSYEDVRLDGYGVRFTAKLPVIGRNGATATIETGWIVRPGERASFVTAFPARKDASLERLATVPEIIANDLEGDTRWEAMYILAEQSGKHAMAECIPKPMVVEGRVYMEGGCGGAVVVVADGRSSFVRWLKKQGIGHRHYRRGYVITADQVGQSAESAKAYADAFARVLRRNGIECRSEIYLT